MTSRKVLQTILSIGFLLGLPLMSARAGDDTTGAKQVTGQGKIEVAEYTYDFGYLPQGATVSHIYRVKNVGKGMLNIVKITPSCGCTTIPLKSAFLQPGEEADLRVDFETRKFTGGINKRIKILSTDPQQGLVELFIRGRVGETPKSISLSGPALRFDSIDIVQREVKIKNTSFDPIHLSILPIADSFIHTALTPDEIKPQEEAILTVRIGKGAPVGDYRSSITIEAKGKKVERITIPVSGTAYAQ